jgi:hypothetical protein
MSWLHFHGKRPAVDEDGNETGELEDYEEDIEVTGAIRVQGMTARGFQSYELSVDGLTLVEVSEDVPAAVQKEREAEAKAARGEEKTAKEPAKASAKASESKS